MALFYMCFMASRSCCTGNGEVFYLNISKNEITVTVVEQSLFVLLEKFDTLIFYKRSIVL